MTRFGRLPGASVDPVFGSLLDSLFDSLFDSIEQLGRETDPHARLPC